MTMLVFMVLSSWRGHCGVHLMNTNSVPDGRQHQTRPTNNTYGSFHLWINVWVAGKTVWSLVNTCQPEHLRDEQLIANISMDAFPDDRSLGTGLVRQLDCTDKQWIWSCWISKNKGTNVKNSYHRYRLQRETNLFFAVLCWCSSKEPELSRELQSMLRCDGSNKLEIVPLNARRRNRMSESAMEIGKLLVFFPENFKFFRVL